MTPTKFWSLVDQTDQAGCWPWLGATNGQGRGRLWFDGRMQYAYRVSVELTAGAPLGADVLACHTCDNPICVNPGHIFAGSHANNSQDASSKGRFRPNPATGETHHEATLSADLIRQAVSEYLSGDETQAEVASRYGVTQSAVSTWLRGTTRADSGLVPARKLKPCGTRAAHERHRRNGETPCDPCRDAERQEQRDRRARRGAAA